MLIFLIELGDGHEECFYSQISFLKSRGSKVHLICNETLRGRIREEFNYDELTFIDSPKRWSSAFSLLNLIKKSAPEKIIFNTLEGNSVKKLLTLLAFTRFELIGTLHDAGKLKKSISFRWLIPLIVKKIFFLNDYVLKHNQAKRPKLQAYYPIFYAPFKMKSLNKGKDEVWVTIPGVVAQKKRDYEGLIEELRKQDLKKGIKIILLGPCQPHMYEMLQKDINQTGLKNSVIYWKDHIEHDLFYTYIQYSDYLMPLIHDNNELFSQYIKDKISGTFDLALGFKKIQLLERSFDQIDDFDVNTIFYKKDNIISTINKLTPPENYIEKDKFSFDSQSKRYNDFVFS